MNEKRARGVKAFRTTATRRSDQRFQTNAARSLVGLVVAARRLGSRVHSRFSIQKELGTGVSEKGFVLRRCVDDAQKAKAQSRSRSTERPDLLDLMKKWDETSRRLCPRRLGDGQRRVRSGGTKRSVASGPHQVCNRNRSGNRGSQ